ncbi:MAG: preprotein translocase subunit YajC [Bacteroidaceae bacterium]|nr:preprotein translocase subunit YajC [Bacteroidaceae bacterium]
MLFINYLQDAAPAAGGGGMQLIIMLVLMFAIMYFFMIRPQKKRQKEIQEFRNQLQVGSKVITSGGIYGVVKELNMGEPYLTIEISKGVNIKIDRNYVFADPNQAAMSRQS